MRTPRPWLVLSMLWLVPAALAAPLAEHAGHHAGTGAQLTLNAGKRWQTDATLRAGMVAVRDAVQAAVPVVHGKAVKDADFVALADRIETTLSTVLAQCELPPAADAQLHLVIAELFAGTAAMKKDGNRLGGVVKVIEALEAYAAFFDHPGWKPVTH